ncbi:MAG: hypothetical protein A3I66_23580 [Burkholderiales bacterium RIFCSPLOWO2_02_FULL_57_36]|nr:MAG: hypothetical protein A3I66_23580 [Burkholderiales bacterium RIFCSPLOWO2_02_FULL_57_36]
MPTDSISTMYLAENAVPAPNGLAQCKINRFGDSAAFVVCYTESKQPPSNGYSPYARSFQ